MRASSWPVVGHDLASRQLRGAIEAGQLAHATLLVGPAQVGKTALALATTQALFCKSEFAPCGQCNACTRVSKRAHPDLLIVEPDRKTDNFLIEEIRATQRQSSLTPVEAPYKVIILRRFDRATNEASNALLKTLEEPPKHVVLFVTLTQGGFILPTVESRCQKLTLRPLPATVVETALKERWGASQDRAHLLSRLSQGRLGWAVSMLNDTAAWNNRSQRLDEMVALCQQGRMERLRYADGFTRRETPLSRNYIAIWHRWWRDVLLVHQGCEHMVANADRVDQLRSAADQVSLDTVKDALDAHRDTDRFLTQNANKRLAIGVLLLGLPMLNSLAPAGSQIS